MVQQPTVVVCGLGPGGLDAVTDATRDALAGNDPVFLRTARHPTASLATSAPSFRTTFDQLYEQAETFDEVYTETTRRLVAEARHAAQMGQRIVYAVPGSPLVLERSVRDLRRQAGAEGLTIKLVPALSFLDEAWARLEVDPVDDGVRLVDGHRFAVEAADQRGPLLVAHAHACWVLSDIKLALDAGPEQRVIVLQGLGTDTEKITEVGWPDLDRVVEPDHLTTLYLPELVAPVGRELARSVEMMAQLRTECPWDREQDHQTLRRYLIEEAYEVVEAIDRLHDVQQASGVDEDEELSAYAELEEELGDLWFQILFHAELATEAGQFSLADIARTLTDKMIHRHPHVYGDVESPDEQSWERLKAEEKTRESAMDDLPLAFPALTMADKMLKRAGRAGNHPDLGAVAAEVERLVPDGSSAHDLAVAALALVARSRQLEVPLEQAVRDLVRASTDRYRRAERAGNVVADWVVG